MMPVVAAIAGVVVVAWLAAGAMAVRSASRIWLRHWAERRLRGAQSVVLYLERPQRLLNAANAGISLMLGALGVWIGWWSVAVGRPALLPLAGVAGLVVLFGHLLPRAVARRWPAAVIPFTMPVLRVADVLAGPLVGRGTDDGAATAVAQQAAMEDLLREGELEGVGRREEIAIISGVMQFGEKTVRDVMTPRAEVFAIADDRAPALAAREISDSAFSRVPVYHGSFDQITGMYHAFDVLKARGERLPALRPVAFAPADTRCNELLFRMLRGRLHLAVVQDASGRMLGVATLEDLLEELVGDIHDEHDEPLAAGGPAAA